MMSIDAAKNKMRQEADEMKSQMAKMLCQQIIDNITNQEIAEKILAENKSLKGCKKEFDAFASKNKSGNESVITPEASEELIFKYFEIARTSTETIPVKDVNKRSVIDITSFL